MQYITPLLLALSAAATVSAVDIYTFSSTGCKGSNMRCMDVAEGECCGTAKANDAAFGSVAMFNAPEGALLYGFSHLDCQGVMTENPVPQEMCLMDTFALMSEHWLSGNSTMGASKRNVHRRDSKLQCREPDVASYENEDGEKRDVRIPRGLADDVAGWLAKRDFASLGALESA